MLLMPLTNTLPYFRNFYVISIFFSFLKFLVFHLYLSLLNHIVAVVVWSPVRAFQVC